MILCFDIGGSRIKAALSGADGLRGLGAVPTPTSDFGAFLAALKDFVPRSAPAGVAISIAGVVNPETGAIRVANIPCADGLDLASEVRRALGVPVIVLNDADSFTLAESRQGAGRGHRNVLGVILGTGVGGGLVIDGKLVSGAGGYAGEWGHGPVLAAPFDFPCGCGLRGCVDAVGGARGMERLHLALGGQAADSLSIVQGWHRGEAEASATVAKWLDLVAPPLAMVLNVVGASVVPAGGGLANDHGLIAALDQRVRSMILRACGGPLVVPALCGPDAGLVGAAEAGKAVVL